MPRNASRRAETQKVANVNVRPEKSSVMVNEYGQAQIIKGKTVQQAIEEEVKKESNA